MRKWKIQLKVKLENFNFALNKPLYEIDNLTNSENFEMLQLSQKTYF